MGGFNSALTNFNIFAVKYETIIDSNSIRQKDLKALGRIEVILYVQG